MIKSSARAIVSKIHDKYFHENLDLHVQSFHLLGFAGAMGGILLAGQSVLVQAGLANVLLNLGASLLAVAVLGFAGKKYSYRFFGWVIVIAVFILAFPILFFAAGGYRSGMPCFFILATFFTTIMLTRRDRAAALSIEFSLYILCCIIAYRYPESTVYFKKEFFYVVDVITGVIISGILLMLVTILQIRMQNQKQTQIRELNRELEARNEVLERYNEMKSNFLATVAHEINTPLAVIEASSRDTLYLLEESPINREEIVENHKRIEQRVMLIDSIVTDLMDTVAIESGRLSLSRKRINLSDLIKNIAETQFNKLDTNNNVIQFDLQPDLPPIWADPVRIEQIMTNLIANSVRYTKNGLIQVALSQKDKRQIVSVEDNGEGMDPEIAQVVLKQYVSTSSEYWRHGIGLYICRQIVQSHGGDIWVNSEKGKGTAITFTLREDTDDG